MNIKALALGAAMAFGLGLGAASAGTIYVQTTPAGAQALFAPSDTLDFEGVAAGVYSSLTQGVLTFTSNSGALHVDADYAGQYNNFGQRSVHSCYCGDSFGALYFDFSQALEGFGFFWGASDNQWNLSAYDASNTLLESFNLPITYASNAGDFVGIFGHGITHAVLSGPASDYVFVDNVTFGAQYVGPGADPTVPEPATWAILLLGFFGTGAVLRTHRRAAIATA